MKINEKKSTDDCAFGTDCDVIWISWEVHRRTIELCRFFGIRGYLFSSKFPRIIRHPLFIAKTLFLLMKERPMILFVQNPSIVLAFISCILKYFFSFLLIVDTHNAGLSSDNSFVNRLCQFIQKKSSLNLVTNKYLSSLVSRNGGNVFVLPDAIPVVPPAINKASLHGDKNLCFICTFAADEPYDELLDALSFLPVQVTCYVPGNANPSIRKKIEETREDVIFTGFLPERAYWELLNSVNLVVDLTTRDDCLVCGAYEAIALGKPILLSATSANKLYFGNGPIFANNTSAEIAQGIMYALENEKAISEDIIFLRESLKKDWVTLANNLISKLHLMASHDKDKSS